MPSAPHSALRADLSRVGQQVDLLAYVDVFWLLAMVGVVMIPIALSLKHIDLTRLRGLAVF